MKTLAARNTAILNRMHMISLGINVLFFIVHFLFSSRSILAWFILNLPALIIEFWFERIGRPTHANGDLKRSGEDLEAKGLTEWMWDITYWTWFCVVLAALAGNKAWYARDTWLSRLSPVRGRDLQVWVEDLLRLRVLRMDLLARARGRQNWRSAVGRGCSTGD
jgi:hypothetical protein